LRFTKFFLGVILCYILEGNDFDGVADFSCCCCRSAVPVVVGAADVVVHVVVVRKKSG